MDDSKKWQGLDGKLSAGVSLRVACRDLGIELKEAVRWLNAIKEISEYDPQAESLGIEGIRRDGVSNLVDLSYNSEDDDIRCKAATALLAHYRDEKKRLEALTGKSKDNSYEISLFGPWDIKKPGV